jgi:4'-phosphopantetheinyl transferase
MPDPVIWFTPPKELQLPEGEIHIWRARLDVAAEVLDRLESTLQPDEKVRAQRFRFSRDRDHFIACRGILRELLGGYQLVSPVAIEFSYAAYGKPAYRSRDSGLPIRFNLSHSRDLAVLAFSRNCEIGIDLEAIQTEFGREEIAAHYFSAVELAELRALPEAVKPQGFFLCWTRKEAYLKARGLGLQVPLDSFSVSLTPGRPESLQSEDSDQWSLHSFRPTEDFVAAVVHKRVQEGQEFHPRYWDWEPSAGMSSSPALRT